MYPSWPSNMSGIGHARMAYNAPMNVVISPQAFKGSLSGMEAAKAIAEGICRAAPETHTVLLPVADGGDGTLEALLDAPSSEEGHHAGGRYFEASVTGPLGEPVPAAWGAMNERRTAVIEMARASGLVLVPPDRRDPRFTTTYGTGELIRAALDAGYQEIVVGLGGSATNDGGSGMAQALGARFLDAQGKPLPPGGAALANLESIDLESLDPRLQNARIRGATDVLNALCGPQGATMIYGPQKGATPEIMEQLEAALRHYAEVVQRDLGIDMLQVPGAGAAGGTGAGLVALLGGELLPGADLICDVVGLAHYLADADLVFTGEGQMDGQTIYNKAPFAVAQRGQSWGVPVIAVVGSLGPGYEDVLEYGIESVEVATPSEMNLEDAMANSYDLVRDAAERAMREYLNLQELLKR